jgi:hypothetical protein
VNELSGRVIGCAFNSAGCLILAKPRLKIKRVTHEPRTVICVFCVHRLPASALKFFLDVQRHKAGIAS